MVAMSPSFFSTASPIHSPYCSLLCSTKYLQAQMYLRPLADSNEKQLIPLLFPCACQLSVPATPSLPIAPPPPLHHPAASDVISVNLAMPLTSPQHHQQVTCHYKHLQRQIGSFKQCRILGTLAGPSHLPTPAQPEPIIFSGHLYTNLPANLAALAWVVAAQGFQPALSTIAYASRHIGTSQPFSFHFPPPLSVTALPGHQWFSGTGTGSPVSAESGRVLHWS